MLTNKTLYSLDDVAIMPATESIIASRSDCSTKYWGNHLPIITAPMPSVVGIDSYKIYVLGGIIPIIPRTVPYIDRINILKERYSVPVFVAVSLDEAHTLLKELRDPIYEKHNKYVCVDVANGNMRSVYDIVCEFRKIINIKIMVGNIANPDTFDRLCYYGADYIRLSIGTGDGCATATTTGVYYGMATLIDECYKIKMKYQVN